jgi:hypothetical protein
MELIFGIRVALHAPGCGAIVVWYSERIAMQITPRAGCGNCREDERSIVADAWMAHPSMPRPLQDLGVKGSRTVAPSRRTTRGTTICET